MHQIGAGVDLVKVLGVVGAVPLVGQVVEAVGLGDLVVLVAVPGHKVTHVERVELGALLGAGGQRQREVFLGHAIAQQFLHRHTDGDAVLDLAHGGVGLLIGVAAVLKADVLAVAEHRGVELGGHVQREGVDQAVHVPGRLAVLLKEFAHQRLLHLDVGLAGDDRAAELLADVLEVVDARLRHGEVILDAEQDGVHVHDLFQHPDLEVAVLAAGDGDGAVIAAGAVHAAVLVAVGLKLLETGIPVHIFAALVVAAGAAHALRVEGDPGSGVGHRTFFAVTHKNTPLFICWGWICGCGGRRPRRPTLGPLCEGDSPQCGEMSQSDRGARARRAAAAAAGGENLAASRTISGNGTVLSLRPYGPPPSQREASHRAAACTASAPAKS